MLYSIATKSNCPLAVLWLWVAGKAETIIATRSDISGWRWHFGAVRGDSVFHFKRTRLVKRQPFAPFYFEGRILVADAEKLKRSKNFLWERHPLFVVPFLVVLVVLGLAVWMFVAALYWPLWLLAGTIQALKRRRGKHGRSRNVGINPYESRGSACVGSSTANERQRA